MEEYKLEGKEEEEEEEGRVFGDRGWKEGREGWRRNGGGWWCLCY